MWTVNGKPLNLDLDQFAAQGLYLLLGDGSRIAFTDDNIKELTAKYWADTAKIPPQVREAVEFQRCLFCPALPEGGVCDAIRPLLPYLEIVDRYRSYDPVIALFKGHRKSYYRLADTTMQDALVYLSMLSLINYCRDTAKYRKYFYSVTPLMSAKEASARIYLNVYWDLKGDKPRINTFLNGFKSDMKARAENQVKRLSLICHNDAFVNAVVKAQLVTEFLSIDHDQLLAESFRQIELEQRF